MNWHCVNPKTEQPEPMVYLAPDEWYCPVCALHVKLCGYCLNDLPMIRQGAVPLRQHFDGATFRMLCPCYASRLVAA